MRSAKDYLLLSILSYCNFSEEDYGKSLEEMFLDENFRKIKSGSFYFCAEENKTIFFEFFKDILKDWKVFYVDNRTASMGEKSSGFYAAVFKKEGMYVIAFRGSEKYPVEDAYKDFVETDLSIGVGKRPRQFWEGLEIYNRLCDNFKIPLENISVTGHSLGGGIAQFVALMSDKERGRVPYTCTWNSVGISRDGIVSVEDFIDYEEILNQCEMTEKEKHIFLEFKSHYLNFLLKELKKIGAIKDNKTVLVSNNSDIYFSLESDFLKHLSKTTNIDSCLSKMTPLRKHELITKNQLFQKFFQMDNLGEKLMKASYFIQKVRNNDFYEENVINFCHSKDLTNALFPHVGSVYQIDLDFMKKDLKRKNIFKSFIFLTKSVQGYHFQDVFLPFIEVHGERKGMFSKKLSLDFISSLLRKLIYLEYCFSKEFLAEYYNLVDITENNYEYIKNEILKGLSNTGEEILYKKQAFDQVNNMDLEQISNLWKILKRKLASPYRAKDIFDLMIFNKK